MKKLIFIILITYSKNFYSQFYNKDINFSHLEIGPSRFSSINFVCKMEGSDSTVFCRFYEEFSYSGGVIVSDYFEEYEKEGEIIEIEKSTNVHKTFNELYFELKRDTYLINHQFDQNYTIHHQNKYQYILSNFSSKDFKKHDDSRVITFNRLLLDNSIPLLVAYLNNEQGDFIIAFFDNNHRFQLLDDNTGRGENKNKKTIILNEKLITESLTKWHNSNDTSRYTYFNGHNLCFSNDGNKSKVYLNLDIETSVQYMNSSKIKGNYEANFNIFDIKKYKKGELLREVKGKVFNKGSIKFINECGGALFINHDVDYQNSYVSYFKEIQLIEDITILSNGQFHLIPFENHFKLISDEGEPLKNINYDFVLGNDYKRRIFSFTKDVELYSLKGKYGIKDKYNQKILLSPHYDTILFPNEFLFKFILTKRKNNVEIFNATFEKIRISDGILDIYSAFDYLQIIEKGKNYFLTADGLVHDKMPRFGFVRECGWDGEYQVYENVVIKDSLRSFSVLKRDYSSIGMNSDIAFQFVGHIISDSDSIKFLNSKDSFIYTSNDFLNNYYNFNNGKIEYLLCYKNNKISINKFKLDSDSKLYYQENRLCIDEVNFINYNQPVYYRIGKLWGCHLLNPEPKFKVIEPFYGNYARVKNYKEEKGWINKFCEEFWD